MEAMEGREQILEEEAHQMFSPSLQRTMVMFSQTHSSVALMRLGSVVAGAGFAGPVRRWHCKAPRVLRSNW